MSKYVIIGGSAGGIGAVEAIREVDPLGELTVISQEPFPQYSRPMISEYVSREATLENMKYRSDQFWKRHNVRALTGRTAVNIDFTKKQVELCHVLFDYYVYAGRRPWYQIYPSVLNKWFHASRLLKPLSSSRLIAHARSALRSYLYPSNK